ncbi:MAG: sarcosine oxidase subunit delta [Betaproteobacteria bacterium]
MLRISCPWCGARDEDEFTYGSVRDKRRPEGSLSLSDEQWAQYLYVEENARGAVLERWRHTNGCRQWFLIERHTVTHVITRVLQIDEKPGDPESADLPPSQPERVGT